MPSRVHSVKATSPTSLGLSQWLRRASAPRGGFLKAGLSTSSLSMRARSWRRVRSLKPVPTLPAKTSSPFSSFTARSRAPKPTRDFSGSVKPTMANSWRFRHFTLSQSLVRPEW
jgi:hypothetical protein